MKKFNTISVMLLALFLISLNLKAEPNLIIISADTAISGGVDDLLHIGAVVKNKNALNPVSTKLKINVHNIQEGQSLLVCWGPTCYPPVSSTGETVFSGAYEIPAQGDSENNFKCDIEQGGVEGVITMTFTFFDENNPSDEASFTATVIIGTTGIEDFEMNSLTVSPNPAVDFINIKFNEPINARTVNISNITGSVVKSLDVNTSDNQLRIDINNLPSGVYFISFISEQGIPRTKRFIISR